MSKFTPSPQEVALVNQIFTQADAQKIGVVNGEAAVKIFSGSKLSPSVLAEIWNLADEDNKGVLTRKDVAVAIRLLGHAQRGERVTEAHIHQPGAPPSIEGLNAPLSGQITGSTASKSPPPGPSSGLPPLTPQDKAKFMKLFLGCGPVNGILPGEKARDVFVKSKLPVDKLSQIWTLADTKNRGALDATDFTVAMYLIQACMAGQLQTVPQVLPPYLYDTAKPVSDAVVTHATGGSGSFSPTAFGGFSTRPVSTIQPQYTGQSPLQPQTTGQRPTPPLPSRSASIPAFPMSLSAPTQAPWDVTPSEKATSDQFFDTLDTHKKGYIEPDAAVPFMVQSKLSDDILAQIWDLSDLNNDGRLTRDGFAVALHLIQGKLAGKEVPATLPPTLIPPSMRPGSQAPNHPPVPEAIKDLLWDDTPPQSATIQQPTVSAFSPPKASTISPQHTAQAAPNIFGASDPFGSSSFGAGLSSPAHKDLLGDDDEPQPAAASPPLQDKSAEIGNVQNQFHSTNRALETAKNERMDLERKLADQATQLSALQTQLSSAKAAYETENRLLTTLRERFSTQSSDIQKARQELIRAESDLSGIRVEKAEVEGSVLRDKEEVRELQRKMTEVGSEVEMLKVEIEKAKKEAKQQKGLLAIAKKQLLTREAERAKIAKELEEAQAEAQAATKEREEAEAELAKVPEPIPAPAPVAPERVASPASDKSLAFAAAQPLPTTPEMSSPASPAMSTKSTNPFERLALGTSPRAQSPFLPFASPTAAALVPASTGGSFVPPSTASGASVAPPSTTSAPAGGDPFGFEEAFGTEEHENASEQEPQSATTTESSQADGSPFGQSEPSAATREGDLTSPDTDHFHTPPTTASLQTSQPVSATEEKAASPAGANPVASPAVESQIPGHFPEISVGGASSEHEDTDLNHQLKELDIEESDSDSEDDEPLNTVKAKLKQESPEPEANASSGSAFDDTFGVGSTTTASTITSPPAPAPAAPSVADETTPKVAAPPAPAALNGNATPTPDAPAGVSDFDEALGKLSGSGTSQFSHVSQFTFDSAFEDDFDFAAAKAATASSPAPAANGTSAGPSFPPVGASPPAQQPQRNSSAGFDAVFLSDHATGSAAPAPSAAPAQFASAFPPPPGSGSAPSSAKQARPFSFDEAFGPVATSTPPTNAVPSAPSNGSLGISFDDAFGGASVSDALALDTSFSSSTFHPPAGSPPAQKTTTPFPVTTTSSPSSPVRATSASFRSARSPSPPPRQTSPPPRHTSPRPQRPSTGSSDKEKPTRHSKLSIRLPFGRKKAKHDPMPSALSQSLLVEEPNGNGSTPAAEDDIDAVKTLCSMGFSRTQAVTALEQHDYDVQRALNSLLGTR